MVGLPVFFWGEDFGGCEVSKRTYDLHQKSKKDHQKKRRELSPSRLFIFFKVLEFQSSKIPSKIEWDLTNGPLSKLLELLDTQVFSGSVQWVLLVISWKIG